MTTVRCQVCDGPMDLAFSATVLERHAAHYDKCSNCGYLCARDPSWLQEAYVSAIADADSGVLMRAGDMVPRLVCLLRLGAPKKATLVDVGGGYGVLVRMLRDVGIDARWHDPYCQNLLARGFEYADGASDVVSAIEVLEHATDPVGFLRDVLDRTGASMIVVTTEVLPEPCPAPETWWYYAFATGQHVSFFERRTLRFVAERLGLLLHSRANVHVFHADTVKRWHFVLASTRLARPTAAILQRRLTSLVEADNPLLRGAR